MSLERGISQAHRHHFSDEMEACETLNPLTDEGRFRSRVCLMLLAKTDSSIMGLMKVSWSSVGTTMRIFVALMLPVREMLYSHVNVFCETKFDPVWKKKCALSFDWKVR